MKKIEKKNFIGIYDQNSNRIKFAIPLEQFLRNLYQDYKMPEMDCLKQYDAIQQIPLESPEIPKTDKDLLDKLQPVDVITFEATYTCIYKDLPFIHYREYFHSQYLYIKICNIKKYNEPNALEKLINQCRYDLYLFHFYIRPTMYYYEIGMFMTAQEIKNKLNNNRKKKHKNKRIKHKRYKKK